MPPVSLAPVFTLPAAGTPPKKLVQVARQFETVLLTDLLGATEKAFSSIPGGKESPGSADYKYMGTQALASGLAASGGFGIAQMIVRNIMKHKELTAQ